MFLHLDLDSFFASAHRAVDNSLLNKAIAVGGGEDNEIFSKKRVRTKSINNNYNKTLVTPVFIDENKNDFRARFIKKYGKIEKIKGIIVTCSYEARRYGVKTAMTISEALRLCPHLIVIPSNRPLYYRLSQELNQYLEEKSLKIEQFSIDEWFIDIGETMESNNVETFAKDLQNEIFEKFRLPISIGVSKAKWIAKLATEDAKPNGIYIVDDIDSYIKDIPIRKFPGIGKRYLEKLSGRGIETLGDVKKNKTFFYSWGKIGFQLYNRINGTDCEGINTNQERKSISIARTFDPIMDKNEIKRRIMILCRNIVYTVEEKKVNPTNYYLEINYQYNVKSKVARNVTRLFSEKLFKNSILEMFNEVYRKNYGVVKISLRVTNFNEQIHKTYSMLDLEDDKKQKNLTNEIQKLREKFGLDIIKNANEL